MNNKNWLSSLYLKVSKRKREKKTKKSLNLGIDLTNEILDKVSKP